MHNNFVISIILAISIALSLGACLAINPDINIIDAKTAIEVDKDLMPVKVTGIFPSGTSKVACWFKWRNAKINTQVLTRWHYITDDIPVLDYTFSVPKKEGAGSVMLTMPAGKKLPSGSYKVDLLVNNHVMRSLKFTVE